MICSLDIPVGEGGGEGGGGGCKFCRFFHIPIFVSCSRAITVDLEEVELRICSSHLLLSEMVLQIN